MLGWVGLCQIGSSTWEILKTEVELCYTETMTDSKSWILPWLIFIIPEDGYLTISPRPLWLMKNLPWSHPAALIPLFREFLFNYLWCIYLLGGSSHISPRTSHHIILANWDSGIQGYGDTGIPPPHHQIRPESKCNTVQLVTTGVGFDYIIGPGSTHPNDSIYNSVVSN